MKTYNGGTATAISASAATLNRRTLANTACFDPASQSRVCSVSMIRRTGEVRAASPVWGAWATRK